MTQLKTIVVVGGSYAGTYLIDRLAPQVHKTHQIVLIQKNSHMHHIFAFPRISVVQGFEQKAFVPYTNAFHAAPAQSTTIIQGIVKTIMADCVVLEDGQDIPYEYLVVATGTGRPPLALTSKLDEMQTRRVLQQRIKEANDVVVVGGGAYGLQLAFDAKELYPTKNVTLIHSTIQLMPRFHPRLHEIVTSRATALGIRLIFAVIRHQITRSRKSGRVSEGRRQVVDQGYRSR
ncbi:FAD/NAD(P)-binding domain-containing protein [Mycena indigotica]|uniref:FAD/NAD(P)-binding domain-containing protein n=1 Tax=Mycena indigotica TaxID=2126181 RepID=A0A8H6T5R5_9AGAR|nr:FAD/NAD(P)-binding domain-containing protein [Mycena indigotica]KAF7312590.1 FAD/NAD(P)-binding domain-containing protein [Mycena indigotica]